MQPKATLGHLKMFAKTVGICTGLLLLAQATNAQCFKQNTIVRSGEKLTYKVSYNWGFIWIDAADVSFSVTKKPLNGQQRYLLQGRGTTVPQYQWLYKVQDLYSSYVDSTNFKPIQYLQDVYEGGYIAKNQYWFNYEQNTVLAEWENSDTPKSKTTKELPKCMNDLISAVYYIRNTDLSNYKIDDKIPMSVIIDTTYEHIYVRYKGKERIKLRNGKYYNCIKLTPFMAKGTMFTEGEDMVIYLSDDTNRIPIMVEAKILLGSVKAILADAKGLRTIVDYGLTE